MVFKNFVVNFVICVILQVFAGVLMPEGKMKGITMSVVGVNIFYFLVSRFVDIFMV